MRAGELDRTITIRRRAEQSVQPGVPFGDFADLFTTRCSIRPAPAKEIAIAGQADSPVVVTVKVYDTPQNRSILPSDRATLSTREGDYGISSVMPPDRATKTIEILLEDSPGS